MKKCVTGIGGLFFTLKKRLYVQLSSRKLGWILNKDENKIEL